MAPPQIFILKTDTGNGIIQKISKHTGHNCEVRTWTAAAVVKERTGYSYHVKAGEAVGRLYSDSHLCVDKGDTVVRAKTALFCPELAQGAALCQRQWYFYAHFPAAAAYAPRTAEPMIRAILDVIKEAQDNGREKPGLGGGGFGGSASGL